jgi:Undecaprenyl-phosphate galactose phosphotransferase WbaP
MADHSLNVQSAGRARLRARGRYRDFALAHRYRKAIVVAALILGDLAAVLLAAGFCRPLLAQMTRLPSPPFLAAAALVIFAFFAVGLYSGSGPGPYERFRQRTIGVAGFIGISTFVAWPERGISEFIVVQSANAAFLLVIGHYIEWAIRSLLISAGMWGAPTVLVGAAAHCQTLAHSLVRKPDLGLKPIGLISAADAESFPLPLITTTDFSNIRLPAEIEVAIFATANDLAAVPKDCPAFAPSCRFILLQDIHNIQGPWTCARSIDAMTGIEIRRNFCSWQNRLLKRMFDILVALSAGLLVLPVVALAAVAVQLVDPGPAFYLQKRIGRHGRLVKVLKLRTMYADGERRLQEHLNQDPQARVEWQRFFKLRQDPRVLPIVGNLMRRSSIDELPQLWNVISGDMSLVGPRPLPAYHVEQFDEEFQSLRTSVPPGITGLWQVSFRSDGDLQILRQEDLFYIRNWSLWLDFYILLQTIPAVLGAKGAR